MSSKLVIRKKTISQTEDGLICLDDIWNAARSPKGKSPASWRRDAPVRDLQIALYDRLYGGAPYSFSRVIRQVPSPQRTFAHPILAVTYASYLSPQLAIEVKEVWLRFAQGDPTLADEILERSTPAANEWAGMRALGRATRIEYTDTLKSHGVKGNGFRDCTDAIYKELLGGAAWKIRAQRQLPVKANLRNEMSTSELSYVMATESLAKDRIEDEDSRGNYECTVATSRSAFFIRKAIADDKADRRKGRML